MIFDESLRYLDDITINNKIPQMIEFMKKYYEWILIISHDVDVINKYDISIKISDSQAHGNTIKYI